MAKRKKEDHLFTYRIFRNVLGIVFRAYYRPKIINKKVIPKEGPVIFCGNHIHLFDQNIPILATKRMVHYMAKREYFDNKKVAWFFKAAGCISVDRAIHDQSAKDKALEVLENGWALGIFPEGTRNKTDATLLPFKMGAVSLAQKTGATIVPYAITGKYKFRNNHLTCTFLKPFKVSKTDDLEKVNKKLFNMIKDEIEKHN